jgi:hypothetical protein
MFIFDEMIREIDEGLIKDFGVDVTFITDKETFTIQGIFDNPGALSAFSEGGWVDDIDAELFVMDDEQSAKIRTRTRVQIGKFHFQVIRPPQRDNAGMVKMVLGVLNGGNGGHKTRRSISY